MYLPRSYAEQPSALRAAAYREGADLVGPEGDPEGWKVLPLVTIKGTLFEAKTVEVECTVRSSM
jgi:hypothetical protein